MHNLISPSEPSFYQIYLSARTMISVKVPAAVAFIGYSDANFLFVIHIWSSSKIKFYRNYWVILSTAVVKKNQFEEFVENHILKNPYYSCYLSEYNANNLFKWWFCNVSTIFVIKTLSQLLFNLVRFIIIFVMKVCSFKLLESFISFSVKYFSSVEQS